ncbi:MAG: mycofactocin-coupled SDR family oxidoreductase [Butyrivibrio sp.]|nr:mycofactocin-coupled SDR family oxidoreductase [Butyrivibrio sp.]
MSKEFENRTIFITGAAKGQGRAVALAFAKEGANIVAFDLGQRIEYPAYNRSSNEDLEKLKSDVEALGARILIYAGDVRKADDVKEAVDRGISEFGSIDILFSNAGIAAYGYSWELTEEQWDALIDVNLKGGFLASKYVIPHMIEKKRGVIIYNSSVAGLRGFGRMSHYSASKHGLVGLTKSQAIELAPYGIRVVSLHPTGVNTPMNDGLAELEGTTPTEIAERSAGNLLRTPWLETEDIVEAVRYIASERARYLTGSQFVLDAGLLTR